MLVKVITGIALGIWLSVAVAFGALMIEWYGVEEDHFQFNESTHQRVLYQAQRERCRLDPSASSSSIGCYNE